MSVVHPSRLSALLFCLALPLWQGSIAHAEDADPSARIGATTLSEAGTKLYRAGLYAQASDTFAKAYGYAPLPSIGLWRARALVKLGRQIEALECLREVTRVPLLTHESASEKKAQATAVKELEELLRQLPSITVQVKGANPGDLSLALDGQPMSPELLGKPQRLNPGTHVLDAWRISDRAATRAEITVKSGDQNNVVLQFVGANAAQVPVAAPINYGPLPYWSGQPPAVVSAPNPPSASGTSPPMDAATLQQPAAPLDAIVNARPRLPATAGGLLPLTIEEEVVEARNVASPVPEASNKTQRNRSTTAAVVGYGSLGTGIASLVGGGILYVAALEKKSALNSSPNCADTQCNGLERSNVDSYNEFRTSAIIALAGGAALVATGLITLYYPIDGQPEHKLALHLGPTSAALRGAF